MKSGAPRKIAVLHYLPLEMYPPVMNLLDVAAETTGFDKELTVYSTYNSLPIATYVAKPGIIKLKRFGLKKINSKVFRVLHYLIYYFRTLMSLVVSKPSTVLYYDSISSFPAVLYKKYFNSQARLFVHYHEFMSMSEYEQGMKMLRFFHNLEKTVLTNAVWVSHTNIDRMGLYCKDLYPVLITNKRLLPNYPPESWGRTWDKKSHDVVRIVQVGSISINTMYVREFSNWVNEMNGDVIWDIYTFKMDRETSEFFKTMNSPWISILDPVEYKNLPDTLRKYDIGVILYKGHIPNYVYNAPNKLFEYHVCGLDVWFPSHMISSLIYKTFNTYPKIIAVDFESLNSDISFYTDRRNHVYRKSTFSATDVYAHFLEELCL